MKKTLVKYFGIPILRLGRWSMRRSKRRLEAELAEKTIRLAEVEEVLAQIDQRK